MTCLHCGRTKCAGEIVCANCGYDDQGLPAPTSFPKTPPVNPPKVELVHTYQNPLSFRDRCAIAVVAAFVSRMAIDDVDEDITKLAFDAADKMESERQKRSK